MATLTVYPTAGTGGPTGDANLFRNGVDETFGTIRGGAGTGTNQSGTTGTVDIQASTTLNQFQLLQRFGATFDTSPLTAGATISSAVLSLWGFDKASGIGTNSVDICGWTPSVNFNFANSDYGQFASTSFANVAYASFDTSDTVYTDFTLNASGISNVSKTGISAFGVRFNWDLNNNFTGSWVSNDETYIFWRSADTAGTTNDPKLVITYTTAVTTGNMFAMF